MTTELPFTLYEYSIVGITYVVDGDTADMVVDVGYRSTRQERFRFAGINAPERGDEPGYTAAKSYVQALAERVNAGRSALYIRSLVTHPGTDKHDSFGRYLATLYEVAGSADMLDVNQDMVNRGLVVPYMVQPS